VIVKIPSLTTWAVSTSTSKLRKEISGVSGKLCFFIHPLDVASNIANKNRHKIGGFFIVNLVQENIFPKSYLCRNSNPNPAIKVRIFGQDLDSKMKNGVQQQNFRKFK
jgi:hypothetical protein